MPTAINNSEKNVENNINILNDNSAVANGKTTKPTVSESVYGTAKEKPVYNRSGLDRVKDDLDAQSISPLSYIYETEPNDSAYTSMPMDIGTAFGTMSSSVDNDWFVLSLEAGRPYTASLKGIPEGDDYDLYIFDPNLLDFGMSFNNGNADEVINFTPVATGNYYIHCDSHIIGSGSDHSYQMLIYPDDTAPDAYEPNDSMGTSKTICNNTPINGTINIDTDEDWFEFNADNAGKLTVTLDSIPNNCDYDVEIYDGDSNVLSGSYFSDNTSEKADLLVGTGNYYVRIYSYSGSSESAYSLNVNLSTPDQYEVNDSVESATEVLVDSSTFGTIDNIKDEDYFRVDIEEAEDYIVELQNIPSGKDYDLSLFDSSGNAVAYSWDSSNNDELINMSLDAGCYYIKVHSYSGFSYEQNYMVSVYKEDALTLSMPYIRASAGDTISVPVAIQNLPAEGLCSFDFAVDYDSTAMTYLDYTVDYTDPNGALVDTEQVVEANEECDGVLKVLFLDNSTTFTKPLNQSGIVIRLNFQVNTGVSDGAYDISCNYGSFAKDSSDSIIGVSHAIFKHGLVMVGSYGLTSFNTDTKAHNLISMASNNPKDGDVNWDGNVNSLDFAYYRKFLLGGGFPTYSGHSYTEVADLDGNGYYNSIDFGRFRQYLLGMISYFPIQALRIPHVTLTSPSDGASHAVGQTVRITAEGENCHHISVFVNGEFIKELPGNNPGYGYISYDYTIPYAGSFTICVKGRNVPGSSDGILVPSGSVTVQGTVNATDEDLMNELNSWADSGTLSWNDYSGIIAGIYQTGNDFFEYASGGTYIKRTNKVVEVFVRNANGSIILNKKYYIKAANTYSGILKYNQMTSGAKANFAKLGTKALVAAGVALDVAQDYFKEADKCAAEGREFDWEIKLSTVLSSAVWSGITTAGGVAIGAWAGSFIPVPVVGTLVGAGVGAIVGYAGSQLTAGAEAETKRMLEDMFRQTFS